MDALIGEVRPFTYNWVPQGWLPCNGGNYPVSQYQILYAVIGNTYGGTPGQNFNVPNLQGRAIVGVGTGPATSNYTLAQAGGIEKVPLLAAQMPNHDHAFNGAIGAATFRTAIPGNKSYLTNFGYGAAGATTFTAATGYVPNTPNTSLNQSSITQTGGGSAHENRQPYLAITYCINWDGEYPINPN